MTVKEVTFVCRSREIFDNDNIYLKIIMDVNTSFQLCNFNYKFQVSASRGFESSPLVLGLVNFKGKNSVFVLGNVCEMYLHYYTLIIIVSARQYRWYCVLCE